MARVRCFFLGHVWRTERDERRLILRCARCGSVKPVIDWPDAGEKHLSGPPDTKHVPKPPETK